jgi:hypothetical protein
MAMREPISSAHPERRGGADTNRTARRMSIDEALQLAAEVAKAENPHLVVVGLTGADGSSPYIEMPIALKGCHVEPCRLSIGFDRAISPAQLRETVRRRIREHLRSRPH